MTGKNQQIVVKRVTFELNQVRRNRNLKLFQFETVG